VFANEVSVQAAVYALLWNVSTDEQMVEEIVNRGGVKRVVQSLTTFEFTPRVLVPVVGLLRNLVAGSSEKAKEASTILYSLDGYKILLDLLWDRAMPKEHKQIKLHEKDPLRHFSEEQRKVPGTKVAEQILAALTNIAQMPRNRNKNDHLHRLVTEFSTKEQCTNLWKILILHQESAMVQFMGFSLISRLMCGARALRSNFIGIGPHVERMALKHESTPVKDTAELLLEEVA